MSDTPSSISVLGLGAMGSALAAAWAAAGHPVTAWNRTPKPGPAGTTAATAREAVAASDLTAVCLLDDASVRSVLSDVDIDGVDLVNLTTSTPGQARALHDDLAARGARLLDGGVMAVPPMIGTGAGHVLYSGDSALFADRAVELAVPAPARFVGDDPGSAALQDVALLSAMNGMIAGVLHAFALIRDSDIRPADFAPVLVDWLRAMAATAHSTADQLTHGDYARGVVSNLAMQVAGNATLLATAEEQGVRPDLLQPYFDLMARRLADGHGHEDTTGVIEYLKA
ncbi:NAD(P)-dependent oxidoreductase [Actinokineospora sp. G85]|uniref:NAD(P)-dependent oxidoreductase n=1 Tax=Actinokineospora sp. G85 TaxID=3406626 RepID=UPI003C733913